MTQQVEKDTIPPQAINNIIRQAYRFAKRVDRLITSLDCILSEPSPPSTMKPLRDTIVTATKNLRALGQLTQERLNEIITTIREGSPDYRRALVGMEVLPANLSEFNTWLYDANQFLTMRYRLKTKASILRKPKIDPHTLNEYKRLNRELLFSQIALGESPIAAVGIRINLDPVSACNFKCVTCYQHFSKDFEPNVIPGEALEKALVALNFTNSLDVFGAGEPTMYSQLSELLNAIKDCNVPTSMLTNGSNLADESIPFENLDFLAISFDGAIKETVERIRLGINFDRTLSALQALRKRAPKLRMGFNVTISRANVDEIVPLVELAAQLGLNQINLTRMYSSAEHLIPFMLTQAEYPEYERQVEQAKQIGERLGVAVYSVVHKDGLAHTGGSFEKEAMLANVATRPVAARKVKTSPEQLTETLRQVWTLDSWLGKLNIAPAHKAPEELNLIEFDLATLQANVDARVAKIRSMPEESLIVPYCMSPWVHNFVSANGGIRPCCIISQDYADLTKEGDLLYHLNSRPMKELRDGLMSKAPIPATCANCSFVERYHSLPEYFEFLSTLGKDPRDLKYPQNYNPPDFVQIKPRSTLKETSSIKWREIEFPSETLMTGGIRDFVHYLKMGNKNPADVAFLSPTGSFFRKHTMPDPSSEAQICSILGFGSRDPELAKALCKAIVTAYGPISPCEILAAQLFIDSKNQLHASVSFKSSEANWLFGTNSTLNANDNIGFILHNSTGELVTEGRLRLSYECIPPGTVRLVTGKVELSSGTLPPGTYQIYADVLRELVNWSNPRESQTKIEFTNAVEVH